MKAISKSQTFMIWSGIAFLSVSLVVLGLIQELSSEGAKQAKILQLEADNTAHQINDRIDLEIKRYRWVSDLISYNAPKIEDEQGIDEKLAPWFDELNNNYLQNLGIKISYLRVNSQESSLNEEFHKDADLLPTFRTWVNDHSDLDFHWELLFTENANRLKLYTIRRVSSSKDIFYNIVVEFNTNFNVKAYLLSAEKFILIDPNQIAMSIEQGKFAPIYLNYDEMPFIDNSPENIKANLGNSAKKTLTIETFKKGGVKYQIINGNTDNLYFAAEYFLNESNWQLLLLFDASAIEEGIEDEIFEGIEKIILTIVLIIIVTLFIYYHYKVRSLIFIDPLTKLLNRGHFKENIANILDLHDRERIEHVGLLLIDIDRFKAINDSFGHGVGDEVLKIIAVIMKKTVRTTDKVYRFGGEEFAVLCIGENLENLTRLAERLRHNVETQNQTKSILPKGFTISIGVGYHKRGERIEDTLKRADKKLYQAKEEGRNRVVN